MKYLPFYMLIVVVGLVSSTSFNAAWAASGDISLSEFRGCVKLESDIKSLEEEIDDLIFRVAQLKKKLSNPASASFQDIMEADVKTAQSQARSKQDSKGPLALEYHRNCVGVTASDNTIKRGCNNKDKLTGRFCQSFNEQSSKP
jgi:hypothetical protein